MASPKKLFLLDGMALVYRAHFALVFDEDLVPHASTPVQVYGDCEP
jgi:5'-3' exonuclease